MQGTDGEDHHQGYHRQGRCDPTDILQSFCRQICTGLNTLYGMICSEPIKPLLLNDMIQEGLTLLFSSMQNERAFYERAVCIDGQNSFESIARSEVSKLLLEIIDQKKQGKSQQIRMALIVRLLQNTTRTRCAM